ncbi:hypothetical protein CEXT_444261 [Caerostris extrusa]|uniref:DUF5641 domain-containing protein n=1 Tax=Caerostris extrusa TaxID=172846 RepID=A0AAV4U117_CAEEX|nr:hypothetical protein CEXT_444261 [Caerostris extrusa]
MCQELKVGDIVLLELENKKRVMWPMGKIEKIYSSRDSASRVVQTVVPRSESSAPLTASLQLTRRTFISPFTHRKVPRLFLNAGHLS